MNGSCALIFIYLFKLCFHAQINRNKTEVPFCTYQPHCSREFISSWLSFICELSFLIWGLFHFAKWLCALYMYQPIPLIFAIDFIEDKEKRIFNYLASESHLDPAQNTVFSYLINLLPYTVITQSLN